MDTLMTPASCADPTDRIVVRRRDLEAARHAIEVAYENAVAAANEALLDFEPFDGLPEAIRILRTALQEEVPG